MTESIKQEIINNIFENGDKLITGPILQTVLIDMIDDVNVKDQEILSKTGSWDDAVTQIPNLATKTELTEAKNNLQGNITSLSESVARDLENVDLTGYATEQWVQNQGYLKEHQDISNLATKTELTTAENNLQGNITSLSESVARDLANVSVPEGVATEAWVQSQDYASKSYVDNAVSSSSVDLTGYATETWVQNQGYLKEHQDISNLATKAELNSVSESVQTDITNLSESVANSAVWKKGTGEDSIVQAIAGGTDQPTATGRRAVAIGLYTAASGQYSHAEGGHTVASNNRSHAEGGNTKASGEASHAEGSYTNASGYWSHAEGNATKASGMGSHAEGDNTGASGWYSHAEGYYTSASNNYEHAQGRYNHSSTNQIFSIGTGNSDTDRRNAVSVLEVDNSGSYTASFFVQNVGGYDGTNPEPGTNDLATAISKVSSIWKKGTGTDSIVQKLTDGNEASEPTATGVGAIAIGFVTTASGDNSHAEGNAAQAGGNYSHAEGHSTSASSYGSHAEGYSTNASSYCSHAEGDSTSTSGQSSHAEGYFAIASGAWSHAEGYSTNASGNGSHAEGSSTGAKGKYSHAEGYYATASGSYSHAEGYYTETSNDYEHAQGQYNHNSANQIFSVGAGERIVDPDTQVVTETRKNAVSILAVPNSETQVVTASFFVQNVGGYDGTNPEPGTNDLATVISGLSSGGGSSETLWKKGTGEDSIVQILSGYNEAYTPTASGDRAIAIGTYTTASGDSSYAEGYITNASGDYSHAEGRETKASGFSSHAEGGWTNASGMYSHAEGYITNASGQHSHAEGDSTNASGSYSHAEGSGTEASNDYEHAQGMYNHSSTNQIFSVGAGEKINYSITRRNALSVLAVPNSETQVVTASFFVQNIGGYDGTNPLPGTNDLATVLNNTETWTFTLEDGSTVTKTIVMK